MDGMSINPDPITNKTLEDLLADLKKSLHVDGDKDTHDKLDTIIGLLTKEFKSNSLAGNAGNINAKQTGKDIGDAAAASIVKAMGGMSPGATPNAGANGAGTGNFVNEMKKFTDDISNMRAKLGQASEGLVNEMKAKEEDLKKDKSGSGLLDSIGNLAKNIKGFALEFSGIAAFMAKAGKVIDETTDVYAQMANVGQTFNGSMIEMRNTMNSAGLTIQTFTKVYNTSTVAMRLTGANKFADFYKAVDSSTKKLGAMGLSMEQTGEYMGEYLELQRVQGNMDKINAANIDSKVRGFVADMTGLSAAVGQTRDEYTKGLKTQQTDKNFQALAATMSNVAQDKMAKILEDSKGSATETTLLKQLLIQRQGGGPGKELQEAMAFSPEMVAKLSSSLDQLGDDRKPYQSIATQLSDANKIATESLRRQGKGAVQAATGEGNPLAYGAEFIAGSVGMRGLDSRKQKEASDAIANQTPESIAADNKRRAEEATQAALQMGTTMTMMNKASVAWLETYNKMMQEALPAEIKKRAEEIAKFEEESGALTLATKLAGFFNDHLGALATTLVLAAIAAKGLSVALSVKNLFSGGKNVLAGREHWRGPKEGEGGGGWFRGKPKPEGGPGGGHGGIPTVGHEGSPHGGHPAGHPGGTAHTTPHSKPHTTHHTGGGWKGWLADAAMSYGGDYLMSKMSGTGKTDEGTDISGVPLPTPNISLAEGAAKNAAKGAGATADMAKLPWWKRALKSGGRIAGGAAKWGGKLLPFAGSALMLGSAAQRAGEGDMTGAAFDTVGAGMDATGVGMIPNIALQAGMGLRDIVGRDRFDKWTGLNKLGLNGSDGAKKVQGWMNRNLPTWLGGKSNEELAQDQKAEEAKKAAEAKTSPSAAKQDQAVKEKVETPTNPAAFKWTKDEIIKSIEGPNISTEKMLIDKFGGKDKWEKIPPEIREYLRKELNHARNMARDLKNNHQGDYTALNGTKSPVEVMLEAQKPKEPEILKKTPTEATATKAVEDKKRIGDSYDQTAKDYVEAQRKQKETDAALAAWEAKNGPADTTTYRKGNEKTGYISSSEPMSAYSNPKLEEEHEALTSQKYASARQVKALEIKGLGAAGGMDTVDPWKTMEHKLSGGKGVKNYEDTHEMLRDGGLNQATPNAKKVIDQLKSEFGFSEDLLQRYSEPGYGIFTYNGKQYSQAIFALYARMRRQKLQQRGEELSGGRTGSSPAGAISPTEVFTGSPGSRIQGNEVSVGVGGGHTYAGAGGRSSASSGHGYGGVTGGAGGGHGGGSSSPSGALADKGYTGDSADAGDISAKYESGGKGVGTISSGAGDAGGVSYGAHQLSSKAGTMQAFINSPEGAKFKDKFAGLTPGSPEFNAAYKDVVASNGADFDKAQSAFIGRTHFDPVAAEAKKMGIDVTNPAIRKALYSQSVQHGFQGNKSILESVIKSGVDLKDSDAVIKQLYQSRGAYASQFAGPSATTDRYNREVKDVLSANQKYKQDQSTQVASASPATPTSITPASPPVDTSKMVASTTPPSPPSQPAASPAPAQAAVTPATPAVDDAERRHQEQMAEARANRQATEDGNRAIARTSNTVG